MYHFFTDVSDICDRDIYIRGRDYNHIKNVLRMKTGEVLSVSDNVSTREYRCHIEDYGEDFVHCRLDFIKEDNNELPVRVHLFQCLPKADKMEYIIQKATELGVCEVIPVESKRSVVKLDEKKAMHKRERWSNICESAAKQSRRALIPEVSEVMNFSEALKYAKRLDSVFIPYELAEDFDVTRKLISEIKEDTDIGLFIGPEGGFDESEIEEAENAGIIPLTLGRRILRTETAALVFMSWLVYRFEA